MIMSMAPQRSQPTPFQRILIIRHRCKRASAVHLALLELDLAGQLQRSDNGLVALCPHNNQFRHPGLTGCAKTSDASTHAAIFDEISQHRMVVGLSNMT